MKKSADKPEKLENRDTLKNSANKFGQMKKDSRLGRHTAATQNNPSRYSKQAGK